MTSKLEQLTEAICEIIPEILELKFGCRVYDPESVGEQEVITHVTEDMVCVHYYHPYGKDWFDFKSYTKGFEKRNQIIGRDITLADVLLAIEKSNQRYKCGHPIIGHVRIGVNGETCDWNLEQNALHLQSEETIDFLNSIICNK